MAESQRLLAVVPARGGSKGLPRKNVLPLAGKPLIGWSIAAALAARCVDRVVVSTDDSIIAEVARAEGAEVPFIRPAEFATDTAGSNAVLQHAIEHCPGFNYVLLLQPTSPLRTAADIDSAFTWMQETGASSCVSVCEVEESPWLMYRQNERRRLERLLVEPAEGLRRQDLPTAYRLNGAIYLARTDWFIAGGRLIDDETVCYVMPSDRSIDIDTQVDFDRTERRLSAEGIP